MTYQELTERVAHGEEFSFFYHGEEYWISQNKDGRYLTRSRGSITQSFKTAEDLFSNGRIEGKTLYELWDTIKDCF